MCGDARARKRSQGSASGEDTGMWREHRLILLAMLLACAIAVSMKEAIVAELNAGNEGSGFNVHFQCLRAPNPQLVLSNPLSSCCRRA